MRSAFRWWPLAAVSAAVIGLGAAGLLPRWPGLVQAVALPPLDLALDLRVLVARAPSYESLAVGAAAAVVVRSTLLAALLSALGAAPSLGAAAGRAVGLYTAAVIPMALAAGLDFAGLAAVYAWYTWAGLGLTMMVALLLGPRLAPRGLRLRRIPVILGSVLGLAAVGAVARLVGPWGTLVLVPVSAAVTGLTLWRLNWPRDRPRPPKYVPRHAAAAVALTVLWSTTASGQAPAASDARLLLVPGVDTASGRGALYRLDPADIGFTCDRVFYFSYRGPGRGAPSGEAACPIRLHRPYGPESTQQPLGVLVRAFADQVAAIRKDTAGAPVVVVTHSQGAAIAWRAVAQGNGPGVSHLVGLAGFPHSPVGYPPASVDGPGRAGADLLRVLSWATRLLGGGRFDPDAPLAREILARPDGLEAVFAEALPTGVVPVLVFTTADLVAAPEGHDLPWGATTTINSTHTGITESPEAAAAIREVLAGQPSPGTTVLAAVLDAVLPAFLPPPAGP